MPERFNGDDGMATSTTEKPAIKFTMNGLQLLASGQVTEKLVVGEHLWLHSKVYSRGGENALHAHLQEDHAFFVLQGAVVFTFGDGRTERAEKFEGVMIPKGTSYKFEAQGSENLIMLRMGGYPNAEDAAHNATTITDGAGKPMLDNNSEQKGRTPAEPVAVLPGKFFRA
jgi:mannose-6-phosphate isomerase-like protein (cupin superfamily)